MGVGGLDQSDLLEDRKGGTPTLSADARAGILSQPCPLITSLLPDWPPPPCLWLLLSVHVPRCRIDSLCFCYMDTLDFTACRRFSPRTWMCLRPRCVSEKLRVHMVTERALLHPASPCWRRHLSCGPWSLFSFLSTFPARPASLPLLLGDFQSIHKECFPSRSSHLGKD